MLSIQHERPTVFVGMITILGRASQPKCDSPQRDLGLGLPAYLPNRILSTDTSKKGRRTWRILEKVQCCLKPGAE